MKNGCGYTARVRARVVATNLRVLAPGMTVQEFRCRFISSLEAPQLKTLPRDRLGVFIPSTKDDVEIPELSQLDSASHEERDREDSRGGGRKCS